VSKLGRISRQVRMEVYIKSKLERHGTEMEMHRKLKYLAFLKALKKYGEAYMESKKIREIVAEKLGIDNPELQRLKPDIVAISGRKIIAIEVLTTFGFEDYFEKLLRYEDNFDEVIVVATREKSFLPYTGYTLWIYNRESNTLEERRTEKNLEEIKKLYYPPITTSLIKNAVYMMKDLLFEYQYEKRKYLTGKTIAYSMIIALRELLSKES